MTPEQVWSSAPSPPELLLVLGAQSVCHCNPAVISGALGTHWVLTCPFAFAPSAQRARALGFQCCVFHRDPAELG